MLILYCYKIFALKTFTFLFLESVYAVQMVPIDTKIYNTYDKKGLKS